MGSEKDRCSFEFYNISAVDAPLLRDYYWNYLNIPEFNRRLNNIAFSDSNAEITSSIMKIPPMPIYSRPIQLIFHIKNYSASKNITFNIKRIKHCDCECINTPVTINKYKMLFRCPHRPMLILTESDEFIPPKGYGYIVVTVSYSVVGKHVFEFVWDAFENRKISLLFEMIVLQFDPKKCVITGALSPVQINDYDSFQQPIWLFNQYGTDLILDFSTEEKSLQFVNPIVSLRKHSIQPLMVLFRPDKEGWTNLNISIVYKNIRSDLQIKARGTKQTINPIQYSPMTDVACPESPYTIFPNTLSMDAKISEDSTSVILVSNFSDKCIECKWLSYVLPDYFHVNITPDNFLCKPGCPIFCVVKVTASKQPSRFHHVPLTLEIHRYVIAPINTDYEHLHNEKESIDDSKIFEPTLITKIHLNFNLIIEKLPKLDFSRDHEIVNDKLLPQTFDRNILEAFLWKRIFNNDFFKMLINNRKRKNPTYLELVDNKPEKAFSVNKNAMKTIFRKLLFKVVTQTAKNWRELFLEENKMN